MEPEQGGRARIDVEAMGAEHHRALARRWESSDALRTLFTKLASEEMAHGEGFRKLLTNEAVRSDGSTESALDEQCLEAIAHGFFSDGDGILNGIENLADHGQVLQRILKFENATLLYYRGLKDVLGPSPTLDFMIDQEKRHAVDVSQIGPADRRRRRHWSRVQIGGRLRTIDGITCGAKVILRSAGVAEM